MTFLLMIILFLTMISLSEIINYDDMILSVQRYVCFSVLAVCILLMICYATIDGLFHPVMVLLIFASLAVLIQSYTPIKKGFSN